MGQYQQWLHFQEIDRRLRATLDALEQELAQLECRVDDAQQPESLAGNPIIFALAALIAAGSNGQSPAQDDEENTPGEEGSGTERHLTESMKSLSSTLLDWDELPDEVSQEMQFYGQGSASSFLSSNHAEIELLPEDMFSFFEEHTQTDPQLELPWWLRKITISTSDDESSKPIDQESIRTNRLVQRWVERWGRHATSAFRPESEGSPDEE